jgi:glycosyltransferase involved in cell wall biosynthesis
LRLGIDLHNIRDGGGVSYISNLLKAYDPVRHGFTGVVLFGSEAVLGRMPDRPCIQKRQYKLLGMSLPFRLCFLFFFLSRELRRAGCDLLYCPGGLYFGAFRPFCTISRNMMPFSPEEWDLYPRWSADRLRLWLLRRFHALTFARADGMIYLTGTARSVIEQRAWNESGRAVTVISHGVDRLTFSRGNGVSLPGQLSGTDAIRVVYPSRLEPYKHQVEVIQAIEILSPEFPGLTLELCGPANPSYLEKVLIAMRAANLYGDKVTYRGEVPLKELPVVYKQMHGLVFASSCENLPNTLIEALSFGIPVASSNRPPMPEVGAEACLYFDPTDPQDIARALRALLEDWQSALRRVEMGLEISSNYSWDRCADHTFGFMHGLIGRGVQVQGCASGKTMRELAE